VVAVNRAPRLLIAAAGAFALATAYAVIRTGTDHPLGTAAVGDSGAAAPAPPFSHEHEDAPRAAFAGMTALPQVDTAAPMTTDAASTGIDPEIVAAAQLDERSAAQRRGPASTASSPIAATGSERKPAIGLPGSAAAPLIDLLSPVRQPPRSDPRRVGGVWLNCAPGRTDWPDHPAPTAPDGSG
jgi:hypothetical protein